MNTFAPDMEAKKIEVEQNYSTLLGNQTIFLITQMHHLITRRTNQELTRLKFPLQVERLPVLFAVFLSGSNVLSQQEIADLLKRDKSGIQRAIRRLERDGCLRVVADGGDPHQNLISLFPPVNCHRAGVADHGHH